MNLPHAMLGIVLAMALPGITACGVDEPTGRSETTHSSRAYKGHASDVDMNHLVAGYPMIAGTRLDDCQSCHTGGEVTSGTTRFRNACDYCHYIPFPDTEATGGPATYEQTLNPYGLAYKRAGRDAAAIGSIAESDSDGDGFTNEDEVDDLRYPGSAASRPGQPRVKLVVLDMDGMLEAMPAHEELTLANSHKQRFDSYAVYRGVRVIDLLTGLGVDVKGITGVTMIAADGYMRDFDAEAVVNRYPDGLFYPGLDTDTKGADCGFVEYPQSLPEGLTDGGQIPGEQWLLLAYGRDGGAMESSYLDPVSGKIEGEGPLRIVVPQATPGSPDRGSSYPPSDCADGYEYDDTKDHNSGAMVRAVVALRVNPMPEGYEEFDAMNGGWAYVDAGQLVVYGYDID